MLTAEAVVAYAPAADRPCMTHDPAIVARVARERRRGQFPDREPSLRLDRGPGGSRFVTYVDTYGDFRAVEWLDVTAGDSAVWDVLLHLYRDEPIDPVFAVIFTSFVMPGGIYYAPLANDVRGIGEGRTGERGEIFDDTANRRLEGYVFMNDVPFWLEAPDRRDQMAMLFNQEIGHRFAVFVRADLGDGETEELLGRDFVHWSYFVHTGASPMEGNDWIDNEDGTFTTATLPNYLGYNSLDLYLMGLIPPDDVRDSFVLRNVAGGGIDCFGALLSASSPPQFCSEKTVTGDRVDFGISEIIAVEGEREPTWRDAPREFETAFVLISSPEAVRNPSFLRRFDDLVETAVAGFHEGAQRLADLIVVTESDPVVGEGCNCRVGSGPTPSFPVWPLLLGLLGRRGRR